MTTNENNTENTTTESTGQASPAPKAKGKRGRPVSVPKGEFIKAWFDTHKSYRGEHEGFTAFAQALIERGSGHEDVASAKNYASVRASALRKGGVNLPRFKRGLAKGQSVVRTAPTKSQLRERIAELEARLADDASGE